MAKRPRSGRTFVLGNRTLKPHDAWLPTRLYLDSAPNSLPKLVELARVPNARRDAFWWDAGDILLDFLLTQGNIHANLELLKNASFAKAVNALKSARQALAQIDDAPREAFRGYVSIAEEAVDDFLASVGELEPKRPRRRGRPSGKFHDPVSNEFVFRLVECAVFNGGKLTFDKNTKEGTLIEALRESGALSSRRC